MNTHRYAIDTQTRHARDLEDQGELEDAEDTLLELLAEHPNNLTAVSALALFLWRQERGDDALPHLEMCRRLDPDAARYPFHIASYRNKQRRFTDAESLLFDVLRLDPSNQQSYAHRAFFLLGTIYHETHLRDDAERAFRAAIHHKPRFTPPYHHLARLLFEDDQQTEALDILKRGLQHKTKDLHLLTALLDTQLLAGELQEAQKTSRRVLAAFPNSPHPHIKTGEIHVMMKQPKEAAKSFSHALRLEKDAPAAHLGLGQAFAMQERFEPALEHLQRALELDPTDRRIYKALSKTLFELDRYGEASRVDLEASGLFSKSHQYTLSLQGFAAAPGVR